MADRWNLKYFYKTMFSIVYILVNLTFEIYFICLNKYSLRTSLVLISTVAFEIILSDIIEEHSISILCTSWSQLTGTIWNNSHEIFKSSIVFVGKGEGDWNSYSLTWSISWLLMPWLLSMPRHQQPWYCLCRIGTSLSYIRKDFNYLCHIIMEEWHKIWINVFVLS